MYVRRCRVSAFLRQPDSRPVLFLLYRFLLGDLSFGYTVRSTGSSRKIGKRRGGELGIRIAASLFYSSSNGFTDALPSTASFALFCVPGFLLACDFIPFYSPTLWSSGALPPNCSALPRANACVRVVPPPLRGSSSPSDPLTSALTQHTPD